MNIKARALVALRQLQADQLVSEDVGWLCRGKAQLEWYPLRPGTVKGVIGHFPVLDDMDGHLRSEHHVAVADINYLNGKITIEPSFRLFADADYSFSYCFDSRKNLEVERYVEQLTRVPRQQRQRP